MCFSVEFCPIGFHLFGTIYQKIIYLDVFYHFCKKFLIEKFRQHFFCPLFLLEDFSVFISANTFSGFESCEIKIQVSLKITASYLPSDSRSKSSFNEGYALTMLNLVPCTGIMTVPECPKLLIIMKQNDLAFELLYTF